MTEAPQTPSSTTGPGDRLGHYRLLGRIGAGGMGEVFRAHDLRLERPVAIKILPSWAAGDSAAVERLVREARLASALNHPGIVTVHAIEESGGIPFLVMELVEGETLRDRLRRRALSLPELVSIGTQVTSALDAAHRVGLIHRDIKSSNILVTPDGRTKVADFGLAKRLPGVGSDPDATALPSLTAVGAVVGTAAYMSPEQSRGEPLDARSDVFSLGVVLYEAATGRLPFEGPTVLSVLHEIALVEPPAPSRVRSGLTRELDHVLLRAMAKDKARRFASAGELGSALRALDPSAHPDDAAAPATTTHREAPPARRPSARSGDSSTVALPAPPKAVPNNLPVALTSFVGRRNEMEEVGRLLGATRLVTLTGAGGCGKSRLAVQIARNLLESFPEGVWLVELAPLSDPGLVVSRLSSLFDVREETGRPLVDSLRDALADRTLLILLDNCEHLTAACAQLAGFLIAGCPGVRILATSREPLGVVGETVWRVPPLDVPALAGRKPSRHEISRNESVRLFVERAAVALPTFALNEANAMTVAQICARLDGIPLAIELAAARIKVLPAVQILSRLEHRFRLLTGGAPASLPHQQTLRAAVDWSYEMLDETERLLFDRLSVFAGGATLESVEAICADERIGEEGVLDLLAHLADKSLLTPEEGAGGSARYRLLETLREYGKERLEASEAAERFRERHAMHFVLLGERAETELVGPDQSVWLERLQEEHDNLRAAGEWALRCRKGGSALRLGGALWRFWWMRGYFSEGRQRLRAALASEDAEGDPGASRRARAKALRAAAILARGQSDHAEARRLLEESLTLARADGDREGIAAAHHQLGNVADAEGNYDEARAHYEAGLELRRELGDQVGAAGLLHNLGVVAQAQGDTERARALYGESLAINRELKNESSEAAALNALGTAAMEQGDYETAQRDHEEALAIHQRLRDKWAIAFTLHELGQIAVARGARARAREQLRESLLLFRELGDRVGMAETLEHFASLAAEEQDDERAVVLASAAATMREALGAPATASDRASLERYLGAARARLGRAEEAAVSRGRSLSVEQAVEWAIPDAGSH